MKSSCSHEWVKDEKSAIKICMWCGIPQVRTSTPRPIMKIPRAEPNSYYAPRHRYFVRVHK